MRCASFLVVRVLATLFVRLQFLTEARRSRTRHFENSQFSTSVPSPRVQHLRQSEPAKWGCARAATDEASGADGAASEVGALLRTHPLDRRRLYEHAPGAACASPKIRVALCQRQKATIGVPRAALEKVAPH